MERRSTEARPVLSTLSILPGYSPVRWTFGFIGIRLRLRGCHLLLGAGAIPSWSIGDEVARSDCDVCTDSHDLPGSTQPQLSPEAQCPQDHQHTRSRAYDCYGGRCVEACTRSIAICGIQSDASQLLIPPSTAVYVFRLWCPAVAATAPITSEAREDE